jgi:transposase
MPAASKLEWHGLPEVAVPSPYTSQTDVRHALVDASQRNGRVFRSKADGRVSDADLNASDTLAVWLLLRPGKPETPRPTPPKKAKAEQLCLL